MRRLIVWIVGAVMMLVVMPVFALACAAQGLCWVCVRAIEAIAPQQEEEDPGA